MSSGFSPHLVSRPSQILLFLNIFFPSLITLHSRCRLSLNFAAHDAAFEFPPRHPGVAGRNWLLVGPDFHQLAVRQTLFGATSGKI